VDDRANAACRRLLAAHLNIPLAAVRILSGKRSRIKRVEVRGANAEQIQRLTGSSGGFSDQAQGGSFLTLGSELTPVDWRVRHRRT